MWEMTSICVKCLKYVKYNVHNVFEIAQVYRKRLIYVESFQEMWEKGLEILKSCQVCGKLLRYVGNGLDM